jgi:hypothetical protein
LVARFLTEFERGISPARFAPYVRVSPTRFDAAVDYYWNIALSEALYPALATLEITLRNSLHDTFSAQQGDDFWFRAILEPKQLREYSNAHAGLIQGGLATPPSGKIVAELNFWFWTSILSGLYGPLWADNKFALLYTAFPNLPAMPNPRHAVYDRCNDIRLLRNRVMHHEPISRGMTFQRRKQSVVFSIDQLHGQIIEAIGWLNSTAMRAVQRIDRFDTVFHAGRASIEAHLKDEFHIR